jgi:hypothetical protein
MQDCCAALLQCSFIRISFIVLVVKVRFHYDNVRTSETKYKIDLKLLSCMWRQSFRGRAAFDFDPEAGDLIS